MGEKCPPFAARVKRGIKVEQTVNILQKIGSNIPLEKILLAIVILVLCLLGRRYLMMLFDRMLRRMPKLNPALH